VSSQDFSPAPYPLYAEAGTGEPYELPVFRSRERYWLYSLLFALTLLTTTVVGAAFGSRSAWCRRDSRGDFRHVDDRVDDRVDDHGFFGKFLFNDRIGLGGHRYDD